MNKITQKQLTQIINMPKIILHLHLDGSIRPETVYKRLKENPLDKDEIEKWFANELISDSDRNILLEVTEKGKDITLEEVKDKLSVDPNCRNLNEYLKKFALPGAVLQTVEQIEESVFELYEDLAVQNVKYAEVRFAPSKHTFKGLTQEEVTEAAIRGLNRAKKELDIDGSLILCHMRGNGEKNKKSGLETIDVAEQFLGRGVSAMDLAGAEALFKTEDSAEIFEEAQARKIPFTIHAGEADGPESVIEALKLGAKRIGHGIRSIENKKLLRYLIQNEIPLEVCLTSNLQTQAVKGEHPLEELYRSGANIIINTDNDTVSSTNIIKENEKILENTNLTVLDIISTNIKAAKAIFAPVEIKAKLIAQIKEFKKTIERDEKQNVANRDGVFL